MKKKKKFFIVLIIIPILIFLWPAHLGGDAGFLMVFGTSMLPTIQPGSFIITKAAESYSVDEIVNFKQSEKNVSKNVVHRIIEETKDGFILKGDNNKKKDPGIINPNDITGRVVLAVPYVGYMADLLRNPVILILIGMSFIAVQFARKKRGKNEPIVEKPLKPQYGLFSSAIAVNSIMYVLIQLSIMLDNVPRSDVFLNFLFKFFAPSFASTIAFVLYSSLILSIYLLAKNNASVQTKFKQKYGVMVLESKNFVHLGMQFFLLIFITIIMFQIMGPIQNLINNSLGDILLS